MGGGEYLDCCDTHKYSDWLLSPCAPAVAMLLGFHEWIFIERPTVAENVPHPEKPGSPPQAASELPVVVEDVQLAQASGSPVPCPVCPTTGWSLRVDQIDSTQPQPNPDMEEWAKSSA